MNTARILATCTLLLTAERACAMECALRPFERMQEQATVIFVGKVIERTPTDDEPGLCRERSIAKPNCGGKIATFDVERTFKGTLADTTTVYSEDGCYCLGSYFSNGDRWLVFARTGDDTHGAALVANNGCLGTGPATSDDVIERLERLESM